MLVFNSWNGKCWTIDLPKIRTLSHIVILKYKWIFLLAVNLFTITVIPLNLSICSLVFEYITLIWRRVQMCNLLSATLFKDISQSQSLNMLHSSFHSWGCSSELLFRPVFSQSGKTVPVNFTALWAKTVWLTGDSMLQKGCHNAFCSFLLEIYCLPQWFLS